MTSYFKSEESIAAYKAANLQHPFHMWDFNYEQFHQMTSRSPSELNQKIVSQAIRIQSPFVNEEQNKDIEDDEMLSGEKLREYIVYSCNERRVDPLGNEKHSFRSNIGIYGIPIPRYEMREDAFGYKERKVVGSIGERIGYSKLFTKTNADKLHKEGGFTSEDPKEQAKADMKRQQAASKANAAIGVRGPNEVTRYMVQREGEQQKISVRSFKDWRDGTFEELYYFGKANVSKDEWDRKKAIDEVAVATKMQADSDILDRINEAANRNKTAGEVYK